MNNSSTQEYKVIVLFRFHTYSKQNNANICITAVFKKTFFYSLFKIS